MWREAVSRKKKLQVQKYLDKYLGLGILLNELLTNFFCCNASLLFFRLAESYSQLVKFYLDSSVEVDKRLYWQVKEIVWKGMPLPPGVCTACVVVRSRQQASFL